jgi:hypothetical protein
MDTIKNILEVAMHLRLSILFVLLLASCGGGGAGNPGTTGTANTWGIITASISPGVDSSSNATTSPLAAAGRDVDIFQTANCSTATGNTAAPVPEPFTDHDAIATFLLTASNPGEDVQDHIVEGYRIDYTTETLGAPPIQSYQSGAQTLVLQQDKQVTLQVALVDIGRKLKLAADLTSGQYKPQYAFPTYTAVYTFFGHDIYGNSFQTVVQTSFEVGDFNYCPATTGG